MVKPRPPEKKLSILLFLASLLTYVTKPPPLSNEDTTSSKTFLCNIWKQRDEHKTCGGVSNMSRNREECSFSKGVMSGQLSNYRGKHQMSTPRPPKASKRVPTKSADRAKKTTDLLLFVYHLAMQCLILSTWYYISSVTTQYLSIYLSIYLEEVHTY